MATGSDKRILHDDEPELLERVLSGEEQAFADLIDRYQQMVFNLAYRFLGLAQEAEDLTQDVFLKVFRSIRSFRGASSLKTWIYRITVNMALNRLKWLKRRRRNRQVSIEGSADVEGPALADTLPSNKPSPDRRVLGAEIQMRLRSALDGLPEQQKTAVVLRDVEGLTYEEIAETLRINIGTVKSRLARGRANLQEMLRDLL